MKFVELYRDGNVKGDIEPEDRMIPKVRKSTATCVYDCDEHTEAWNKIQEVRRGSGLFVSEPKFQTFNAPWN